MQKFTVHTGIAAVLMRDNIDTDSIIPSREMKSVSKSGLGVGLFAAWRYLDEKARTPDPQFVLNQAPFAKASILLSGANFGCGSSREHAVWALKDFGIRCIIAEGFGSIFSRNCVRNGILPIALSRQSLKKLEQAFASNATAQELEIDLHNKQIRSADGYIQQFEINESDYHMLLHGLDQITLTKKSDHLITEFREKDRVRRPWIQVSKLR